ncbi:MAG: hypothetical protein JXA37_11910 [Chloroflexia bacterium]|nr:hypothetical protein [Chloroflexia bacterium]
MESFAGSTSELLRQAIAAAQGGQRERAQSLLMRVLELDERNVQAWLWLSGVVKQEEDRITALENVLALDPSNQAAVQGLEQLRRQRVQHLLQQGIESAQKGWVKEANQYLRRVVELDERNVTAWLWLSSVVGNLDEMEVCLQNVLAIDPDNAAAQRGLEQVQQQKSEHAPKFVEATAAAPSIGATDILEALPGDDLTKKDVPPTPSNEYGCPYCGKPTDPEDERCPSCRGNLWVRFRQQEHRSTWFWVALTMQIFTTAWYFLTLFLLLAALIILLEFEYGIEFRNPLAIMRVYFGATSGIPPDIVQKILQTIPRALFFSLLLPVGFSAAVLVGLLFRWRPAYFAFLANALYTVVIAFATTLNKYGPGGLIMGTGLFFPILSLVAAFQMRDDFFMEKRRILLRTDPDISGGLGYLVRGREYARLKMWALAAVHLERATGQMPHEVEGCIWLALSYIETDRYDSAKWALDQARRINTNDPRIADVAKALEKRQG